MKEFTEGEEVPSDVRRWHVAMHELSIAQNILDIVQQYVPPDQQNIVKAVRLKVGDLAGVVPDSLEFCFAAITTETRFKDVSLVIERTPFTLFCRSCQSTSSNEAGIVLCPACGGSETTVVSGTELQVCEIELQNESAEVL